MSRSALEIVGCPGCTSPAEVVDRFVLKSAKGPIEHVLLECLERHRYTVLAERLDRPWSAASGLQDRSPSPDEGTAWRHP
ncbi:hypothetical protein Acsp06_50300 [Actinomycetospora sp. NBRC 106375]|nr:hypothetical protein Acsp06_50300 [Actinomycetospora sp. NBRC 106375]